MVSDEIGLRNLLKIFRFRGMRPVRPSYSASHVSRLPLKHDSLQMMEIKMRSRLEAAGWRAAAGSQRGRPRSSWDDIRLRLQEITDISAAIQVRRPPRREVDTREAWRSLARLSKYRPAAQPAPRHALEFGGQLLSESLRKLTDFVTGGYVLDKEEDQQVDLREASKTHRRFYSFAKLYSVAREQRATEADEPAEGTLGELIWRREYQPGAALRIEPNLWEGPRPQQPKPPAAKEPTGGAKRRRRAVARKGIHELVRDAECDRTLKEIKRMQQAVMARP